MQVFFRRLIFALAIFIHVGRISIMASPTSITEHPYSEDGAPFLSVDVILRLKAEYEADVKLLEELPARIKAKKRKYEASLFFAPPNFDPDSLEHAKPGQGSTLSELIAGDAVSSTAKVDAPSAESHLQLFSVDQEEDAGDDSAGIRLTWAGELDRLLSSSPVGISHQDALAKLKETSLGERVSQGEKGFYNAVARLEKKGLLFKSGGLLYSSKLVDEMKSRGELLPDVSTETRRRAGGSGTMAIEVLRLNPDGLDANALREEMRKLPGVSASVVKHGHYIYNILGTLMGQGEIERDAQGVYKLKGAK